MNTIDHLNQTRPWRFDVIPNQGNLDTVAPAYALDLAQLARACDQPRRPTLHHPAPAYALPAAHIAPMTAPPRKRDWVDVVWWIGERIPGAIVITMAFLLALALYRAGGPA